jgi:quinol monooxygenase YgiN
MTGPDSVEGVVRLVAIHPVENYERWKKVLDETAENAAAQGVLRRVLYRSVDDPNEYLVSVDFRSRAAAEAAMLEGEQLQSWLDKAGVTIYPPTFVGIEVDRIDFGPGTADD